MKIDISRFGIRTILKNTGDWDYSEYPRDIEGTILEVHIERNKDLLHVKGGNYKALFNIEDTFVMVRVRWDNDTKGIHSTSRLYIRNFGRCPGLQSIWNKGSYNTDNRPFHTLKPMTKAHIQSNTLIEAFKNNKYSSDKIAKSLESIEMNLDGFEPAKIKPAKAKKYKSAYSRYTTTTTGRSVSAYSGSYRGATNYGSYINTGR